MMANNRGAGEEIVVRLLLDLYKYGKQTTKELAARYDCSVRTIYRKIDILSCVAPVVVEMGRNGGVSLLPDYEIRRAVRNV